MFRDFVDAEVKNPFAGKKDGEWLEGTISTHFLQENFGGYKTIDECVEATESEGLKLFFEYLKTQQ